MLVEKGHVVGQGVEKIPEDELEEVLGKIGVVVQIGEGDLRFDHPELGQMPGCVGILCTKGWPKVYTLESMRQ